jgi:hypothetical protein
MDVGGGGVGMERRVELILWDGVVLWDGILNG